MAVTKSSIARRYQVRKVMWITLIWMILGSIQFWFERSVEITSDCVTETVNLPLLYLGVLATFAVAGIVGGSVVVFFFEKWIRIWPYWRAGAGILLAFSAVFLLTTVIGFVLTRGQYAPPEEAEGSTWRWLYMYVLSFQFLRGYLIWFLIVMATLLGLVVYDKYGPGTMRKVLLGKYFKPRAEERVFMFLDLRSSTQIAERLGEEQYFNLLRDVIQDATTPILTARGEIYQYVGDEIVITWPTKEARHNVNCLNCFFAIREAIQMRAAYYRERYGILPEYKAGLHYGKVIAGEIGVIKRDITYTGDVLNTTSRIQDQCNELGVDILLSKHLLDFLKTIPTHFNPREIGAVPLRGKSQNELLYTV